MHNASNEWYINKVNTVHFSIRRFAFKILHRFRLPVALKSCRLKPCFRFHYQTEHIFPWNGVSPLYILYRKKHVLLYH